MIGVILAAGKGSRLKSGRNDNPCKPLIELHGKHLIEYSLENLYQLNIRHSYLVVGQEGYFIEQAIGSTYKNMHLNYVYQDEPKGLIHALIQVLNRLECCESIALQLSDEVFIGLAPERILQSVSAGNYDFYCGITPEADIRKIQGNYSVELDDQDTIRKCVEKPLYVTNNLKGTGFCIFTPAVLCLLKEHYWDNAELLYDLCDYMNWLTAKQQRGNALFVAEKEFNINTFADLMEAEIFLSK